MPSFRADTQSWGPGKTAEQGPLAALPGGNLKPAWGRGDEVLVVGLGEVGDVRRPALVDLKWNVLQPDRRQIAYDLVGPFEDLHFKKALLEEAGEDASDKWHDAVLQYSKAVRTVLAAAGASTTTQENGRHVPRVETILASALWELVELFYADVRPHGILTEELRAWLRRNHAALPGGGNQAQPRLLKLQQLMQNTSQPLFLEEYWGTIAQLVAIGWTDEACALLQEHGSTNEKETGLLEVVEILISHMPHFNSSSDAQEASFNSLPAFHQAKEAWKRKIQRLLLEHVDGCSPETRQGLGVVLKVMMGDLKSIRPSTGHWAELMVANLLHHQPQLKAYSQLLRLVQDCMKEFGIKSLDEESLSLFDGMVLAVLRYETEDLLAKAAKACGPWFISHLTEVLALRGPSTAEVLTQQREALGNCSLEEYYRLVYARELSTSLSTWQVAVVYLSQCPAFGKGTLEGLLESLPVTSDHRLALKALEVCRQKELPATAAHICRTLGIFYWQQGHLGAGVAWLQRARDDKRLSAIAEQLLARAMNSQNGDQVLEEIGPLLDSLQGAVETPAGGSLAFLQRYRELRGCLGQLGGKLSNEPRERVLKQAASCIVQLLGSGNMAPPRLWATVLKDALPLIEWKTNVVFGIEETHLLMSRLQELRTSHKEEELVKESEWVDLERLDLALATNLARAFLMSS